MPKLIITNVPGLDGEYELDFSFTHRDFRTIKQLTGVRANEVMDALEAGDLDIVVALAEIALTRAGVVHRVDQLWDAEAGAITLDVTEEEEAESPPPPASEPSSSASEFGPSDESEPSGSSTNGSTEPSPETSTPAFSGTPRLVSTSDQATSTS